MVLCSYNLFFNFSRQLYLFVGTELDLPNWCIRTHPSRHQCPPQLLLMVYSNYFHVFCSSISIAGKVFMSPKEISDIIERKKQFTNKVMDALIKFSRHLLRTENTDGEKLMFDVLGSKFVSQLTRLFSKFFKLPRRKISYYLQH